MRSFSPRYDWCWIRKPGHVHAQKLFAAVAGGQYGWGRKSGGNTTASGNLYSMIKKALTKEELTHLTQGLNRLARNLWWTWDQGAQEIFYELSPRGWQNLYHNAVAVLREVSENELRARLQDLDFAEKVRTVLESFDRYMNAQATWAHQNAPSIRSN